MIELRSNLRYIIPSFAIGIITAVAITLFVVMSVGVFTVGSPVEPADPKPMESYEGALVNETSGVQTSSVVECNVYDECEVSVRVLDMGNADHIVVTDGTVRKRLDTTDTRVDFPFTASNIVVLSQSGTTQKIETVYQISGDRTDLKHLTDNLESTNYETVPEANVKFTRFEEGNKTAIEIELLSKDNADHVVFTQRGVEFEDARLDTPGETIVIKDITDSAPILAVAEKDGRKSVISSFAIYSKNTSEVETCIAGYRC